MDFPQVLLIVGALVGLGSSVEGQQTCPQPEERTDLMVKWLVGHPLVREPPYPRDAVLAADYIEILNGYRSRIDLVGLRWDEVQPLNGGDLEICRSLRDWLFSQPGIGPESHYAFYRARHRYLVAVWKQLEPRRIRLGRYEDTFVAVLNGELALIEKVQ